MLYRSGYAMSQWLCRSGYAMAQWLCYVVVAMAQWLCYVVVAMLCRSGFAYGYVDENFSRKTAICFVYWSV